MTSHCKSMPCFLQRRFKSPILNYIILMHYDLSVRTPLPQGYMAWEANSIEIMLIVLINLKMLTFIQSFSVFGETVNLSKLKLDLK